MLVMQTLRFIGDIGNMFVAVIKRRRGKVSLIDTLRRISMAMDMILNDGQQVTQMSLTLTRTLSYAFLYSGVSINSESTDRFTDMSIDSMEAAS